MISPLIYCASSAWLFSNQQVFRNVIVDATTDHLYPKADHYFWQFLVQKTPGTPFLILFYILLLNNMGVALDFMKGQSYFSRNLKRFVAVFNFAPFFEVLRQIQKEYWIAEEVKNIERIGEKRMDDKQFGRLNDSYMKEEESKD